LATFRNSIRSKLPSFPEIIPVFSFGLLIIFSWTLYRFFWHVPSWLYYLKILDLFIIAAYTLSFAFFESLFFIIFIIFLSILFPARFLKHKFIVQGSTITIYISIAAIALQRKMRILYSLDLLELIIYPLLFALSLILLIIFSSFFYDKFEKISQLVKSISDRITIFLYLYIPISIISFFVVIFRNAI